MGLSNLVSLTEAEYNALKIVKFRTPPGVSKSGDPDSRVDIEPSGWIGNDTLAFIVTDNENTESTITIDANETKTLSVEVSEATNASSVNTYWTVDMGTGNGSLSQWSITYDVNSDKKKKGKWVFTKSDDDVDPKTNRGCLGFLTGS